MGFLYELQSQVETMKDEKKKGKPVDPEHMRVIEINLPRLTEFCGMKAYTGDNSTESLTQYMKEAEEILRERGNKASRMEDGGVAETKARELQPEVGGLRGRC